MTAIFLHYCRILLGNFMVDGHLSYVLKRFGFVVIIVTVGFASIPTLQIDFANRQVKLAPAAPMAMAATSTVLFSTAATGTTWTVPAGVSEITVKAWGGGGGAI